MSQAINVYMYFREQLEPVVDQLRAQGIANEIEFGLGSEEAIVKACDRTTIEEVTFDDLVPLRAWGEALTVDTDGLFYALSVYEHYPTYRHIWRNLTTALAGIKARVAFTVSCSNEDLLAFDDTRSEEPDAVIDEYERDPYEMYGISVPDID